MKRRRIWLAAAIVAALIALIWPGPAGASTTLGGYTGSAYASVIHAQVYEPTIPIPASPQGDVSVGYAKSTLDTGPSTRATASYLWPGDVIGDGFDQLLKQPGKSYPIQVNSRFPATQTAPESNRAQLTDGNGMATSTDGDTTKASVTLLGLAGPDTNLTSGVLAGTGQLAGKSPTPTPTKAPAVPLPVSSALAALITAQHVTSSTKIELGDKTVTSSAHAAASNISLLGGLISIAGLDVTSQVVSDGTHATPSGKATLAGIKVAGLNLGISDQGIDLGAGSAKLPDLSPLLAKTLKLLGIQIDVMPTKKTADGASAEFSGQVLTISIDTMPLKSALNGPLSTIISAFPQKIQSQLSILVSLGPKLVLSIGDVDTTASAAPGYDGTYPPTPGQSTGPNPPQNDTGGTPPLNNGTGGTPPLDNGTLTPPNGGGQNPPPSLNPYQNASMHLPPLGTVPRMLILGALALAALLGWAIRTAGGVLLGGARSCNYGLATGVPDLRKG